MSEYLKVRREFINNEFIIAPPIYSVIYIYLLNKANNNELKISLGTVEEETNIAQTEIINCLKYFDRKKIVLVQTGLNSNDVIINFDVVKINKIANFEDVAEQQTLIPDNKPTQKKSYTPIELDEIEKKNKKIKELYMHYEEVTGKLLNHKDRSMIYSFYNYYNLSMEVIHFLFDYSVKEGKTDLRYIEKIAIDWSTNNIKTMDDALNHLNSNKKEYKQIVKALGIQTGVVASNKEIMDRWLDGYKMPLNLILEACKRTVIETGKPSLKYTESILSNWNEKNIRTMDDVNKLDSEHKKETEKKYKDKKQTKSGSKPSFTDYNQRNWDYDEIERRAVEKLKNSFK